MSNPDSTRKSLGGALSVFLDRRILVMLGLGFSAGLPNLLIFDTLSAWLREAGLSLQAISFFGLATLVYSFKFLWAPLIDRSKIPWLTARFGHRRSWMLVAQAAIVVGLWLIAGTHPEKSLALVALFAVLVGFSSATQDIVIDAWRIEAAEQARQGAMAAAYQWGYRIAIVVAGAVPLFLAQSYGWALSYSAMAALMAVGVVAVLFAPREKAHLIRAINVAGIVRRPVVEGLEWVVRLAILVAAALVLGSGLKGDADILASVIAPVLGHDVTEALRGAWIAKPDGIWLQLGGVIAGFALVAVAAMPLPGMKTLPGAYLSQALGGPLKDFFDRFGKTAGLILALICLYRVSDFVLNIMNPFYLDLGFSKTEIGEIRKVFGTIASMFGVFVCGFSIARWGLMRPLIVGALGVPIANLTFAWLATRGHDVTSLIIVIGIDNTVSAFAGTCLVAYMSSLTAEGFTATQYALFSSLYSLPGKLIASQSGRIVETSARAAEAGGPIGALKGLFSEMPPGSLAVSAAKLGVAPAALGAGYATFFIYSCVIGFIGVALAIAVAARQGAKTKTSQPAKG
jgi:PAT family beta-lactamase induction signal transducer AmpG